MARYARVEFDRGLAIVTLDRPDRRNAISNDLGADLLAAVEQVAADPKARAVLLRGEGGMFCVGGDVKDMAAGAATNKTSDAQKVAHLRNLMRVSELLHDMPKPTVAQLEGAAAGGGLSLALACDLRVAGKSTKITTAFAKVGLPGDFGCIYLMTKLIGSARARELFLTCPLLTADAALTLGLVNRVVADAEVSRASHDLAMSLAQGPSLTLGMMKQNLNLAEVASFSECLDREAERQIAAMLTHDHKEAAKAFVEKRAPAFTGR